MSDYDILSRLPQNSPEWFQGAKSQLLFEQCQANLVVKGGCWIWTGAKLDAGTPGMTFQKRKFNIARFFYTLFHSPLAVGEYVRSTCGNPQCLKHLKAKPVLSLEAVARLWRTSLNSIDQMSADLGFSRSSVEKMLKKARREKLLLPVEAEGIQLTPEELVFYRRQGYQGI